MSVATASVTAPTTTTTTTSSTSLEKYISMEKNSFSSDVDPQGGRCIVKNASYMTDYSVDEASGNGEGGSEKDESCKDGGEEAVKEEGDGRGDGGEDAGEAGVLPWSDVSLEGSFERLDEDSVWEQGSDDSREGFDEFVEAEGNKKVDSGKGDEHVKADLAEAGHMGPNVTEADNLDSKIDISEPNDINHFESNRTEERRAVRFSEQVEDISETLGEDPESVFDNYEHDVDDDSEKQREEQESSANLKDAANSHVKPSPVMKTSQKGMTEDSGKVFRIREDDDDDTIISTYQAADAEEVAEEDIVEECNFSGDSDSEITLSDSDDDDEESTNALNEVTGDSDSETYYNDEEDLRKAQCEEWLNDQFNNLTMDNVERTYESSSEGEQDVERLPDTEDAPGHEDRIISLSERDRRKNEFRCYSNCQRRIDLERRLAVVVKLLSEFQVWTAEQAAEVGSKNRKNEHNSQNRKGKPSETVRLRMEVEKLRVTLDYLTKLYLKKAVELHTFTAER